LGRKVLNPRMSSRSPSKRSLTRWMTPSVLILMKKGKGGGKRERGREEKGGGRREREKRRGF